MNVFRIYLYSLFAVAFLLTSCKSGSELNPDFVGTTPTVVVDTLAVTDFQAASFKMFSGALNIGTSVIGTRYTLAGAFDDALFGKVDATTLLRPALFTLVDSMTTTNTRIFLRLVISEQTGDTTQIQPFSMREITRVWRGNAWAPDSSIQNALGAELATFSYTKEDTLLIELPDTWKSKYWNVITSVDPDSAYQADIFGFTVAQAGSTKLITIDGSRTGLQFSYTRKNFDRSRDTTLMYSASLRSWATSYTASTPTLPAGRIVLDNLQRNMISLDVDARSEIFGTSNVLRAELVMYEDTLALKSTLISNQIRPKSNAIEFLAIRPVDTAYDLYPISTSFFGTYESEDGSYRTNITSILNEQLRRATVDEFRFYASYKSNGSVKGTDGSLYQTLLFGPSSSQRKPILIITYVKPDA